jgi:gas vesicle protein
VGQDPGAIRQDIEQTRERMGDTVEALGYKTNVTGRAKEAVSGQVESMKAKAGVAQENPLGLALGAVGVGFLAGMLIPSTRVEDEKIGPVADQVKDKARETGEEAMERGKDVAQQAAQSAKETAQEAGREHAEGLKESAQAGSTT